LATAFTRPKNKKGITAIQDLWGSWNGYAFDLQPFWLCPPRRVRDGCFPFRHFISAVALHSLMDFFFLPQGRLAGQNEKS
jgi:hypothetical protein